MTTEERALLVLLWGLAVAHQETTPELRKRVYRALGRTDASV